MIEAKNIYVFCPGNLVTGGAELEHQLVQALRWFGHNAFICYHPLSTQFQRTQAYLHYDAPQAKFVDDWANYVIFDEGSPGLTTLVKRAGVGIWWLSVDNFFAVRHITRRENARDYIRYFIKGPVTIIALRDYDHFAQSFYALSFLAGWGIKSTLLTDYIGSCHSPTASQRSERQNIIVYNPKKGFEKTRKLIDRYANFEFVPIKNMSSEEVASLFSRARIYIDFGYHPGKDRLPREAALAGCCVITGRRGSAQFKQDVPIDEYYKLDDLNEDYLEQFGSMVDDIFGHFENHTRRFDSYRRIIEREQDVFMEQVKAIFGDGRQEVAGQNPNFRRGRRGLTKRILRIFLAVISRSQLG